MEVQANRFAVYLLMPRSLVNLEREKWHGADFFFAHISKWADKRHDLHAPHGRPLFPPYSFAWEHAGGPQTLDLDIPSPTK